MLKVKIIWFRACLLTGEKKEDFSLCRGKEHVDTIASISSRTREKKNFIGELDAAPKIGRSSLLLRERSNSRYLTLEWLRHRQSQSLFLKAKKKSQSNQVRYWWRVPSILQLLSCKEIGRSSHDCFLLCLCCCLPVSQHLNPANLLFANQIRLTSNPNSRMQISL